MTEYHNFKYHQLEERRGYMSCHVGGYENFAVFTTPISKATFTQHLRALNKKIKDNNYE